MKKGVRIVAKGVKRNEPDLRKLARALIQLVMEQQAKEQLAAQIEDDASDEAAS